MEYYRLEAVNFTACRMNEDLILQLYSRPETVFTISEIAQIVPQFSFESLRDRLYYFCKAEKLLRLRRGIYAKKGYEIFEAANKVYVPSYVSLETVLGVSGVTFQYYESIFMVSYLTREIKIDRRNISYRLIKGSVLTNLDGVEKKNGYFIATVERAFLDAVYVYGNYYFDNLRPLNWEKIESLKLIYQNRAFEKRVEDYHKNFLTDYVKR